jgi:hypothetical protein
MKQALLLFFVSLILTISSTGFCEAAFPDESTNISQDPGYWIHLDPVSDKHVNDTFVITGTTNIPAGELIDISTTISYFPHSTKHDISVNWNREYSVPVQESYGQNTFTTPPVRITSSEANEVVRVNDEYVIIVEYKQNDSYYVETSQIYWIWAADVSLPFWIHIDPVSEKHVNETLVITGTTNVPAGGYLSIVSRPAETSLSMNDTSVSWGMEYAVSVRAGSGGRNTFETSPVRITPSSAGGKNQVIRAGDEYIIVAQYLQRNLSAENAPHYRILAPEPSIVTPPFGVSVDQNRSIAIKESFTQKSPVSSVIVIFSPLLTGFFFVLFKKRMKKFPVK